MLLTTTTQSHLKIILLILIFLKTSYEVENVLVILLARAGAFLWLRRPAADGTFLPVVGS